MTPQLTPPGLPVPEPAPDDATLLAELARLVLALDLRALDDESERLCAILTRLADVTGLAVDWDAAARANAPVPSVRELLAQTRVGVVQAAQRLGQRPDAIWAALFA